MATFHVDYLNGSNTNDGSAANPYATVKYALETNSLGSGDDVKVAGGGETTVDSAATFAANNQLTTSSDLTTSISVGDIVRIDPPNPSDYQGWMVSYVTAITATTITFQQEILLPGTYTTGNWTIKTLDYVVTSTASTFETWADSSVGAGVDIVFGYNSTFTSVIGRTYFRKSVGAGSTSGTLFRTKFGSSAINNGNTANFVNLGSLQWNEVLRGEFGGSHLGDNNLVYESNGNVFGYFGAIAKKTATQTDHATHYLINVGGSPANLAYSWSYTNQFSFYNNYKIFSGNRAPQFNQTVANDVTLWNPGQAANDGAFGETNFLRVYSTRNIIKGHLKFNLIDNSRAGFSKGGVLFGSNSNTSALLAPLDGFTILDGGISTGYFDFISMEVSKVTKGTMDISLPTGSDLTTMPIKAHRDTETAIQPNVVVRDDNYVWKACSGAYAAQDSVNYSTGNSSKTIFVGNRSAYATDACLAQLFGFTKQAANPVSYSITYKNTGGSISSNKLKIMLGDDQQNLTGSFTMNSATFTTITVNASTAQGVTNALAAYPTGSFVPVVLNFDSTSGNNKQVWIDSITVNY